MGRAAPMAGRRAAGWAPAMRAAAGGRDPDAQRIRAWTAIAELWVDNAVDLPAIAAALAGTAYSQRALAEICAYEVAPVVWRNLGFLMNPLPPAWQGFDAAWLVPAIAENVRRQERSAVRRLWVRNRLTTWMRTRIVAGEWAAVLALVAERRRAAGPPPR